MNQEPPSSVDAAALLAANIADCTEALTASLLIVTWLLTHGRDASLAAVFYLQKQVCHERAQRLLIG